MRIKVITLLLLVMATITSAKDVIAAPPAIKKSDTSFKLKLVSAKGTSLRWSAEKCKRDTCLMASVSLEMKDLGLKDLSLSCKTDLVKVEVSKKEIAIKMTLLSW